MHTKTDREETMNELDLIKEVEKRPILYDKSMSGFNKTKLRDEAWKDVQDALCVSETECKKRWRSLRDSFIKLQRTHGGRTRWPYHFAMRFLLPHIDPKPNEVAGATKRDSEDQLSESEEDRMRIPSCPLPSLPDLSFPEDDSEPSAKKSRQSSTSDDDSCSNCNRTDPDELFLLSCAPTLKRLSPKQNAVARLKIQQVLYEAEFGCALDLPYVTPASDCSFDHIDGTVEVKLDGM